MDLTTLAAAVLLAVGLLGADVVVSTNSVEVEVTEAPKLARAAVDRTTLEQEFVSRLDAIANVTSVVTPQEIYASTQQGIGMALAESARLKGVAFALRSELGFQPDRLRLALYTEDDGLRGLVTGSSHRVGSFRQIMVPYKDEALIAFVRRCALWGGSELAPYSTALYLLEKHSADKDFTDVVDLVDEAESKLPPSPESFDRSILDNLLGIVALFKNDPKAARQIFDQAIAEDPKNIVPHLNAAFTDLELDEYSRSADRMLHLVTDAPPSNKILLSTAYMTWAAAELGLHDISQADALLAKAVETNPDSSSAIDLWAQVKVLQGNKAAADELHRKAMQATASIENYGEVAALYFQLSWQDNVPVTRSKFVNPKVVAFH